MYILYHSVLGICFQVKFLYDVRNQTYYSFCLVVIKNILAQLPTAN